MNTPSKKDTLPAKTASFLRLMVLFISATGFFLSLAILLFVVVTSVRSLADIKELSSLVLALIAVMASCLLIIRFTGLSVKQVLKEWLKENGWWFLPY